MSSTWAAAIADPAEVIGRAHLAALECNLDRAAVGAMSAQQGAVDAMLQHELRDNYFLIDDPATPDQSRDISSLDRASTASEKVLKERGTHAAQRASGSEKLKPFLTHIAPAARFYHGPHANSDPIDAKS